MPLGRIRGACECWDCGGGPVVDKRTARQQEKMLIENELMEYYTELKEETQCLDLRSPAVAKI